MRIDMRADRQATREPAQASDVTTKPSLALALASVGVCLTTALVIALIAILA